MIWNKEQDNLHFKELIYNDRQDRFRKVGICKELFQPKDVSDRLLKFPVGFKVNQESSLGLELEQSDLVVKEQGNIHFNSHRLLLLLHLLLLILGQGHILVGHRSAG